MRLLLFALGFGSSLHLGACGPCYDCGECGLVAKNEGDLLTYGDVGTNDDGRRAVNLSVWRDGRCATDGSDHHQLSFDGATFELDAKPGREPLASLAEQTDSGVYTYSDGATLSVQRGSAESLVMQLVDGRLTVTLSCRLEGLTPVCAE